MKTSKIALTCLALSFAALFNSLLAQSTTIKTSVEVQQDYSPIGGDGPQFTPPPNNLVSLKESVKADLKLYPNPSNGIFKLESNLKGSQDLRIYDLAGNLRHQETVFLKETSKIIVDLSAAPKGIYLVNLGSTTLKYQKI